MYETLRNFTDEEKAELMRNSEEMRMFLNNTVPVLTHEDTLKLIQPTLVPSLIEKLGYCPVMRQIRTESNPCTVGSVTRNIYMGTSCGRALIKFPEVPTFRFGNNTRTFFTELELELKLSGFPQK